MACSVMVFTRDLRVTDNPALAAVASAADVVPLFVFDDEALARCRAHANRLAFLLESLHDLGESLGSRGAGALVVRRGDWVTAVIETARAAGGLASGSRAAAGTPASPRAGGGRAGSRNRKIRSGL
jgi:deoxyribodipyrimidine photo-lyase